MKKIFDINFYKTPQFHIHVDLTNACNFNCQYCYAKNMKSNHFIDISKLINFIERFKASINKEISLWILGGEPTLHNDLLKLIETFPKIKKHIYSNFSSSLKLYKKIIATKNTKLFLSYHHSQMNINNFINKLILINENENQNISVILMDETDFHNEIPIIYEKIRNLNLKDVSVASIFNNINSHYKANIQKTLFNEFNDEKTFIIQYDNKNQIKLSETELYEKLPKQIFKGMMCNASIDSIYINPIGNIYPCPSAFYFGDETQMIGNISSTEIKKKMKLCTYQICCLPHIMKLKIN